MNITFTLGWWLVPAAITVALWLWALRYNIKRGPCRGDYDFGVDIVLVALAALLGTSFSWAIFFAILYFIK